MARAATAPARPRTAPAPRPRPRTAPDRRRSGAAVPTRAPRRARRTAPGIGLARRLETPVGRMLDALLAGRAWIVLIGVLLVGIVFFNVSLLGLNQGITKDSERAQTLEQQNTELRLQVASLASTERITQLAAKKGMVMPPAGDVAYVRSHVKGDAHRALARIRAPGGQLAASSLAASTSGSAASSTPTRVSAPAQPQAVAQQPLAATPPAASSTTANTPAATTTP
jgi:cell division protein FtsL